MSRAVLSTTHGERLAPATAEPIAPIADLPIRFRAALLDIIILSVLQALLGVSVQNMLTLWLAYFVLFEGFFSATPAKEMFGLRVMTLDGRPCGLRRAIGRNLLRIIDWLPAFTSSAGWLGAFRRSSSASATKRPGPSWWSQSRRAHCSSDRPESYRVRNT